MSVAVLPPKEKKPKTEKAASEVSSNSAPSPAPVTTPASIPSATGDVDTDRKSTRLNSSH